MILASDDVAEKMFQFLLGRLKTGFQSPFFGLPRRFQFLLGRLKTRGSGARPGKGLGVSIPAR